MGADLQQQVMDQIMERRKRTLLASVQTGGLWALAMGRTSPGPGTPAAWRFRP
jgi:hypothetical protein